MSTAKYHCIQHDLINHLQEKVIDECESSMYDLILHQVFFSKFNVQKFEGKNIVLSLIEIRAINHLTQSQLT